MSEIPETVVPSPLVHEVLGKRELLGKVTDLSRRWTGHFCWLSDQGGSPWHSYHHGFSLFHYSWGYSYRTGCFSPVHSTHPSLAEPDFHRTCSGIFHNMLCGIRSAVDRWQMFSSHDFQSRKLSCSCHCWWRHDDCGHTGLKYQDHEDKVID